MEQSRPAPSASLWAPVAEGFRLLARHPRISLGLLLLGTLLAQLGPALELLAKSTDPLFAPVLFGAVGLLPMELYFTPRWLTRLDAELLDHPANPAAEWRERFEGRWLRAFGAGLLVQLLAGLGSCCILPMLLVLTLLGWTSKRVLLRGESLREALRWSGSSMARIWPRIVLAALAIGLVWLLSAAATMALIQARMHLAQDAVVDPLTQLKRPVFWVAQAWGTFFYLWMSAAFLSLYHRTERLAAQAPSSASR